jgi:hypothetical protein
MVGFSNAKKAFAKIEFPPRTKAINEKQIHIWNNWHY